MTTAPFTVTRIFKAPLALLWEVHTSSSHQRNWLSPDNPAAFISRMDFRVGGTHFYGSPMPDGSIMYGRQVFREIVPMQKVVALQSFTDKDGNIAPHPLAPTWPREMLSTNLYEDLGNGTSRLSVTWQPYNASAEEEAMFDSARPNMTGGWDHQFAQIEAYLARL